MCLEADGETEQFSFFLPFFLRASSAAVQGSGFLDSWSNALERATQGRSNWSRFLGIL